MSIRLQKYLSECGVASRRKAEELIESGRIKVNGKVAELGDKVTPGVDRITVGKKPVLPPQRGILLLNKPKGVVTTMSDPGGRSTVAEFLDKRDRGYFPVGRLDYESTGLVVLTNDGELANRMMHPRYGLERVYEVQVSGEVAEKTIKRMERGVRLKDGMVKTAIKHVRVLNDKTNITLSIQIGRNRVIRRMMEHLRHPVVKLKRIAHGPLKLSKIRIGDTKRLTKEQYKAVKKRILESS